MQPADDIIKIQNVTKTYAAHTALSGVSFDIPRGCIFGLLGPNGAGKTSLIRIITQITRPDEGQIIYNGRPLKEDDIRTIGYLPEERGLYKKMKVGEQLLYLARLKGFSKPDALQKLKYWFVRFDIKDWWDKKIEDLSKGMQQKIQFVATVLTEPKLLILDEPFSGFDPINANIIKDEILALNQRGTTVIFSTHRMSSVEQICSHLVLINRSQKVLEGKTNQIRHDFKQNIYKVEGIGKLPEVTDWFQTSNVQTFDGGRFTADIKIQEDSLSPNKLIQALIQEAEIHTFAEVLPTIDEIFIQVVESSKRKMTA